VWLQEGIAGARTVFVLCCGRWGLLSCGLGAVGYWVVLGDVVRDGGVGGVWWVVGSFLSAGMSSCGL